MEAIVLGDGRIPVRQTLTRSASSLVSIASGGSIGREGSMVQLAVLGTSVLGRALRLPKQRLRLMVACGAAAGLTAAYSAPIAGAIFVAEIVLGSIAMESVGPIMVSSVAANITMRHFLGYRPPYEMPAFDAIAGADVLPFALMGILLGGAAALFLHLLGASRRTFERLALPLPARMALGGLIVGALSLLAPEVWGNGYSVVNDVLHDGSPWTWLAIVLVLKAAATLATAGSGAVGGVFTPTLFFGCMLGSLFGQATHAVWAGATAPPSAYAMVGMAGFLAGATQAPLMAMLMLFEMTLSHQAMLPLIVTCVIAYFVARTFDVGSMYEISVRRNQEHEERTRLRALRMRDLIEHTDTLVRSDATLAQMRQMFDAHPVKYLYVVDGDQRLLGLVPLRALGVAESEASIADKRAGDLMTREIEPVTASMTLTQALQRFLDHRGERLPVIESAVRPVLLGTVSKSRLLATFVRLSGEGGGSIGASRPKG
jgi:CIC family chloride channel protein